MLALVSKATQVKTHHCPELYFMEAEVSYIFITIQVTTGQQDLLGTADVGWRHNWPGIVPPVSSCTKFK